VRCAIASGGGTVFKVEGASARKKMEKFCIVNCDITSIEI